MPPLTTPVTALLVMAGFFFFTMIVPMYLAKAIHVHVHENHPRPR